jgi:hypothetical protein
MHGGPFWVLLPLALHANFHQSPGT